MHELSLMASLVERVEEILNQQEEEVQKVISVTIMVGALSGVEVTSLEFCYPEAIRGTLLEGSELRILQVPLEVICSGCGEKSSPDPTFLRCPHCGAFDVQVILGKEFRIIDLEVL